MILHYCCSLPEVVHKMCFPHHHHHLDPHQRDWGKNKSRPHKQPVYWPIQGLPRPLAFFLLPKSRGYFRPLVFWMNRDIGYPGDIYLHLFPNVSGRYTFCNCQGEIIEHVFLEFFHFIASRFHRQIFADVINL